MAAFVDALDHPPLVTSVSPLSGTTTDTITIRGLNLLPVQYVDFNGTLAYVETPGEAIIRVKVPKYINTIAGLPQAGMPTTFKLVFRTRYGTSFESKEAFQWLDGKCADARITQAYLELADRPARGTGTSGECNPAAYGTFTSAADVMAHLAGQTGEVAKRTPPQISYLEPWKAQPGTTITIGGLELLQVKEVWFGTMKSPSFSSEGGYTMKAVVPEGGSGKVRVVTYSGSAESAFEFEVTAPPVIESVTPKDLLKGDRIFIHGKNFNARLSGMVNGVFSLAFDSITPTDLVVRTDNLREEQNATLSISTDGGTTQTTISVWEGLCDDPSLTGAFDDLYARRPLGGRKAGQCSPSLYGGSWPSMDTLYSRIKDLYGPPSNARLPVISGLSPAAGAPGGLVMIDGANFINKTVSVSFNGVASREVIWRGTKQLQVRIPDGATTGPLGVRTMNGSTSATFTVDEGLSISRVTPGSGVAGAVISLRGTGFDGVTATVGGKSAQARIRSSQEVDVTVPKDVSGNVEITLTRPDGLYVTRENFPVYQINLRLPDGAKSLKDARVELVAPDGRVVGTTHLIGNAGASLTDNQIADLIGNAGAGLIGNAGAGLIANGTARLIGNAGAGLSLEQLGRLIGNAGAGFDAKSITGLIGNAGAGFKADLSKLIGNSGVSLAGNAGATLAGNAGATLAGNAGATLAGNAGSTLAGNAGSTLAGNAGSTLAGNAGATLAGNAGATLAPRRAMTIGELAGNYGVGFGTDSMIAGMVSNITSRSIESISTWGQIVPTAADQRFTAPPETTPAPVVPSIMEDVNKEAPMPIETTPPSTSSTETPSSQAAPATASAPVVDAPQALLGAPVESSAPEESVAPTTEPAPVAETVPATETTPVTDATQTETAPAPAGDEEASQVVTDCPLGFTYSPTLQLCIEDAPEETSPYAGLPCNDYIPLYQQKGCIPQ